MSEEKIIEGNKLIAEFMGGVVCSIFTDHVLYDMGKDGIENKRYWANTSLKFHSSYDWLMPVVEKIEKLENNIQNESREDFKHFQKVLSFSYLH